LDHDSIASHSKSLRVSPACFGILPIIPGERSSPKCPGTVTRPGLDRVCILAIAPAFGPKVPAVFFDALDDITYLHAWTETTDSVGGASPFSSRRCCSRL